MIEEVTQSLCNGRAELTNWIERLREPAREAARTPEFAAQMTCLSYVDGFLRIQRTTPLILGAIERLDRLHRSREAAFWMDHLKEEAFHDRVMRRDLSRLIGVAASAKLLRKACLTPPSAALLGYFEWQVRSGNPSLLIALRLFLEWYICGLDRWRVAHVDALVQGGSATMRIHKDVDEAHYAECLDYITRYCGNAQTELLWSVEYVGHCLADAQAFIAGRLLDESAC